MTRQDPEERLALVLWSTGDELWDVDLVKNEFTRTNPLHHFEHTAGGAKVVTGVDLYKDLSPEDRAEFDCHMIAHLKGQTEYMDVIYRARSAEGEWRWVRTRGRVTERDASGRALRMLGTSSDVTEFKRYQEELEGLTMGLEERVEQRTEALRRANQKLQSTIDELKRAQRQLVHAERLAGLGALVAGVAHEINTPLGISVTAASFLEQETRKMGVELEENRLTKEGLLRFRQTASDSSQLILRNLMRADKLVKSFKQVAVDQSSEHKRVIDLGTYLQEVMNSLHPELKRTTHKVKIDCPAEFRLDTYPGAIFQITANLVMNALIHAFPSKSHGTLSITASKEDEQVRIVYRDDGAGMTEPVRQQIFDPFFTTRRGAGGSGLGLHIVWNLATQVLGGTIACESTLGEGSTFELCFPAT